MKTIHWLILGIICLVFTSCGSDDEPEAPYTGPWEIHYIESWVGIHNNSQEFEEWFLDHTDCFVEFYFNNGTQQGYYTDYIELNDYKNYCGEIYWLEIIPNATEDEVKQMVDDFESFTIIKDQDKKFDIYQAKYERHKAK